MSTAACTTQRGRGILRLPHSCRSGGSFSAVLERLSDLDRPDDLARGPGLRE